jgi:hypothetical protein
VIRRRWAVAGLALVAALALGTAACQKDTPGASPSSSAKSAIEQLGDAAAKTKGQSFTFTLKWGDLLNGSGAMDASATNSDISIALSDTTSGMKISAALRTLSTDSYLKLDLGALGAAIPGMADAAGKWMHIDATKLPADLTFGIKLGSRGVLGVDTYVSGVTSAEKKSDTEITGKIDLGKAAFPVGKDELTKLPDDQRIVPFTATLDAEGRISKLTISMPKVASFPAADLVLTYADWGKTVELSKPAAAETVEAPQMLYTLLASV